jgi:hypothetical protein
LLEEAPVDGTTVLKRIGVIKGHVVHLVKENMYKIVNLLNVKCPLVLALRLCTDRTAYKGSRGVALLYRH